MLSPPVSWCWSTGVDDRGVIRQYPTYSKRLVEREGPGRWLRTRRRRLVEPDTNAGFLTRSRGLRAVGSPGRHQTGGLHPTACRKVLPKRSGSTIRCPASTTTGTVRSRCPPRASAGPPFRCPQARPARVSAGRRSTSARSTQATLDLGVVPAAAPDDGHPWWWSPPPGPSPATAC